MTGHPRSTSGYFGGAATSADHLQALSTLPHLLASTCRVVAKRLRELHTTLCTTCMDMLQALGGPEPAAAQQATQAATARGPAQTAAVAGAPAAQQPAASAGGPKSKKKQRQQDKREKLQEAPAPTTGSQTPPSAASTTAAAAATFAPAPAISPPQQLLLRAVLLAALQRAHAQLQAHFSDNETESAASMRSAQHRAQQLAELLVLRPGPDQWAQGVSSQLLSAWGVAMRSPGSQAQLEAVSQALAISYTEKPHGALAQLWKAVGAVQPVMPPRITYDQLGQLALLQVWLSLKACALFSVSMLARQKSQ